MKKKRIFLAVLASMCVAAGAAGLAACGGNNDAHDPALYAAYQTYAAENENAKPYEEWVADILSKLGATGEQGDDGQQGDKGDKGDPGERGDDGMDGLDGEDGVSIDDVKMVELNGKQYFEFTFSNGKVIRLAADGSDRQETTAFTITAVDNNGDPVADAYFNIGYGESQFTERLTKSGTTTTNAVNYYAVKTNSKGVATFYLFPEAGEHTYNVYIADPVSISNDGAVPNVPHGYTLNFGTSHGLNNTSAEFSKGADGSYSVTVNFIVDNSWGSLYDSANDLEYKRYATDPLHSDEITEAKKAYIKRAVKDKYNYFSFSPYNLKMPAGELNAEEKNTVTQKAIDAASGVYRFSFKASNSGAHVQLRVFDFLNGSYFVKNVDGSPAESLILQRSGNAPTDSGELQAAYQQYRAAEGNSALGYEAWLAAYTASFSGGDYVELKVEQDQASAMFCLGFVTDINCDVTITVERVGDVTKWSNTYSTASMPEDEEQAVENDGRILDVPMNSVIVRDDDGVYHIGSLTGPEIYVQLKNPTRANGSFSMEYLSDYSETSAGPGGGTTSEHLTVFNYYTETVDEATNTGKREYIDYTDVVKGYAALANSDGGYPVNDLLKTVLENFCKSYVGWSSYDEYWVAACYYYGAPSDGSEASPYDVNTGNNSVILNSTATYLSFRPATSGYYVLSTNAGTLAAEGGTIIDGNVYAYASSSQGITFTVTGSGTATVNIASVPANSVIGYSETFSQNPDGTFTQNTVGTAENPVRKSGSGVYQVNIDHSLYSGKVAVDFTAILDADGNYRFEIFGSSTATIEVNGRLLQSGSSVALTNATAVRMLFDDVSDGTFFINVTKLSS